MKRNWVYLDAIIVKNSPNIGSEVAQKHPLVSLIIIGAVHFTSSRQVWKYQASSDIDMISQKTRFIPYFLHFNDIKL